MKNQTYHILISIFLGICLGFIFTMSIVTLNIGNIQKPNGLMYQKDCILLNSSILMNDISNESSVTGNTTTTGYLTLGSMPCSDIACSSNCFMRVRNCSYDSFNYVDDTFIKDLIKRDILKKEYCKTC